MLEQICSAMLAVHSGLQIQFVRLHKAMLAIVRNDQVCRRLMTTPGVGPLVAITFKTGVDDPSRIGKSKAVRPLFGLTPVLVAQAVGNGCGQAARDQARKSRLGAQNWHDPASDVGRRQEFPLDQGDTEGTATRANLKRQGI